jgi:hypothetical protein
LLFFVRNHAAITISSLFLLRNFECPGQWMPISHFNWLLSC